MARRSTRTILFTTSVFAGAIASCCTPAQAQTAGAAVDSGAQIQEIVVTAQKRSENLQKASISIDAVRGEDLAKAGIHSATDLQDIIPDVRFQTSDELTVNIRGLGTSDLNGGVDSAVAYAQDGIYLSHPAALAPILFDMQRVEVLLGPQGTLYGRNSNGGVVNFITADPEFKLDGHIQAGYGNYNALTSELAANAPLSDKLALRVSFASEKHDPWQADGTASSESYAGRIKLLYNPIDTLSILLAADASSHKTTGTSYGWVCPPGVTQVAGCLGVNNAPWSGLNPVDSPLQGMRDKVWGVSATINLELPWAQLTSLTAYKHYTYHAVSDPGLDSGVNEFDFHHYEADHFFTQELRLASKAGSSIKWVAGLFYSNESQPFYQQFDYNVNTAPQVLG